MRISVVIPVYNGEDTLAGCIESLLGQSVPAHEIIVVNDGSSDGTVDVAERYAVRLLDLGSNQGAARAKNCGAEVATGDVLFFTDADCHLQSEGLACIQETLVDPEIDGVVGLLGQSCPYPNFASQFKNLWMHFTYARQPRRVGLFFTSAAAIRRETFEQEGGFDPHYAGASITEDIEFGQRLLAKDYLLVIDKRLTVEHQKYYAARGVLRTDLQRARGLFQTYLRNKASEEPRAHYASVPWYFQAGVGVLGLGLGLLLAGVITVVFGAGGTMLWLGMVFCLLSLLLNAPFLLALTRWRGLWFGIKSAGFLSLDLLFSGLGILWGLFDTLRGKCY